MGSPVLRQWVVSFQKGNDKHLEVKELWPIKHRGIFPHCDWFGAI